MAYRHDRHQLTATWADKEPDAAAAYWAAKNPVSIDGLPAMPPAVAPVAG
jgi:hypothetical protein